MKVLVTGGGGFLGFAIVKQLLVEGHEVLSYTRSRYEALEKLGVSQHQGNLTDYSTLKTALRGCEAVFHTAGKIGNWGTYASFYETNVRGTENLLKACAELQVPYLIYTSSPSVVYNGSSEGKDERLPYPPKFDAYYPQTKAIAEQAVLKANCESLHTCSLRPHLIWGPGDFHFLPSLLHRQNKGRLRLPSDEKYRIDTIYIDNAAGAHLQAFEVMRNNPDAVSGKAYFLSQDEPIGIREFFNRLLDTCGRPAVNKTISPRVALFTGWLFQHTFRLFNVQSEPPLTLFVAKHLASSHWYDISAAKRDFGYAPRVSIEEGLMYLRAWIEENHPYHFLM